MHEIMIYPIAKTNKSNTLHIYLQFLFRPSLVASYRTNNAMRPFTFEFQTLMNKTKQSKLLCKLSCFHCYQESPKH